MSIVEALSIKGRKARQEAAAKVAEREARITDLSKRLADALMDGDGNIGRRMRDVGKDPLDKERPLKDELLERGGNHPLLEHTLRFTEMVLPTEHFKREDRETAHIRHSLRTALLLQDFLLTTDLPPDEIAVRVCIALAHDNEEEPQERLMKNRKEGLPDNARGGRTQEDTREKFNIVMNDFPPGSEYAQLAAKIYEGIHAFNRHYADNTTKFDEDYMKELEKQGLQAEKVVDRGMDSPHGDMSRIARMIEAAVEDETKMATLQKDLKPRFERLAKSINKARKLRSVAKGIPSNLEGIEELFEATILAGDNFPQAVAERLRDLTAKI